MSTLTWITYISKSNSKFDLVQYLYNDAVIDNILYLN